MGRYDAIIIGAGIAGFGVGGLLQGKGWKTLILEKSRTPGGRCKTFHLPGGWRVDSGTHAVDLGMHSACATLLKRLGKEIPWSRNIEGAMLYDEGGGAPAEYLNLTTSDDGNWPISEPGCGRRTGGARRLDRVSLNS